MEGNPIKSIHMLPFPRMMKLEISGVGLNILSSGVFEELISLEYLDVSKNNINLAENIRI